MNGFRDMSIFVASYEERSFTAAAKRENATQSGVSQHIRKLEDSFGVKLFLRERASVVPTPAADTYYRHCVDLLRSNDEAQRAVRSFAHGMAGELTIGLMPALTRCALAPALSRFIEVHPNISVRIVEGYSAALTQQVRAGELDFAIVPAFPEGMGLKSRLFLRTPELLVTGCGFPVSKHGPVRLADIAGLKLVVPSKANIRRARLEAYFVSNGVRVDRVLELDSMFCTLAFVSRSDWAAILPAAMMEQPDEVGSLRTHPIAGPDFMLDLVLIERARHSLSPAAKIFLEELKRETSRLAGHRTSADAASRPSRALSTRRQGSARSGRKLGQSAN